MFLKHKIFGFYVILSLSFIANKVSGETDLSLLIKDHNTVAQDSCYSIIKDNPCAQRVLKTLVDKIDNILHENYHCTQNHFPHQSHNTKHTYTC